MPDEFHIVIRFPLPTVAELSPLPESPDARRAQQRFLGKTEEQALAMFQESFALYQEDLKYMGAPAFMFYFSVAIRHAESPAARHDPALAAAMLALMRYRWKYEWAALLRLAPLLLAYCAGVIRRADQMVIDPKIHGNLKNKYERFLRKLQRQTKCYAKYRPEASPPTPRPRTTR